MAEHDVHDVDGVSRRGATVALLDDLAALDELLAKGAFDRVRRIGAEQEIFLVDGAMRPAPIAVELLAKLSDPRFTTEIARFNLEANLPPAVLAPGALDGLAKTLREIVDKADAAARTLSGRAVLVGILPTLSTSDLALENLSPNPRYRALNDTLAAQRGQPFHLRIDGVDRFETLHENVLFEACTTSFQLHLQVTPEEFAPLYNIAQAISGPLLSAAACSPILMGHRLWQETRIALFEHATDARSDVHRTRRVPPRVRFGDHWIRSILDLHREDATRYPLLVAAPEREDPFAAIREGRAPRLRALCAHNGTVWRWNRACYGVSPGGGLPHLRIENRVLPAGPTTLDEVGNAALFFGLMLELQHAYGPIDERLRFEDAKRNFFSAARDGLLTQLRWMDGKLWPAAQLLLEELLPLALRGLERGGLGREEATRYLEIVAERVRTGRTGAEWMLESYARLGGHGGGRDERDRVLVAEMLERQQGDEPVHRWAAVQRAEPKAPDPQTTVERVMRTNVCTIEAADAVALARRIIAWEKVGSIAVEDSRGMLLGVVRARALVDVADVADDRAISEIMDPLPLTTAPETLVEGARALLAAADEDTVFVVRDGLLLGAVAASDLSPR